MFRGVNQINLDTKGRLSMPSRYREELNLLCAGELVLTIETEARCVLLYPIGEWEKIQEKIARCVAQDSNGQECYRTKII